MTYLWSVREVSIRKRMKAFGPHLDLPNCLIDIDVDPEQLSKTSTDYFIDSVVNPGFLPAAFIETRLHYLVQHIAPHQRRRKIASGTHQARQNGLAPALWRVG